MQCKHLFVFLLYFFSKIFDYHLCSWTQANQTTLIFRVFYSYSSANLLNYFLCTFWDHILQGENYNWSRLQHNPDIPTLPQFHQFLIGSMQTRPLTITSKMTPSDYRYHTVKNPWLQNFGNLPWPSMALPFNLTLQIQVKIQTLFFFFILVTPDGVLIIAIFWR